MRPLPGRKPRLAVWAVQHSPDVRWPWRGVGESEPLGAGWIPIGNGARRGRWKPKGIPPIPRTATQAPGDECTSSGPPLLETDRIQGAER